jgi:hypothetical protein
MLVFIFSITSLLHVSVCYIRRLQGEPLTACTKPSAVYCVFCPLHFCAIEYNTYTFLDIKYFVRMIKTTFLLITQGNKKTFFLGF